MRTNMGGGLPISGFYEIKQEGYEIYQSMILFLAAITI